ncbi:MAG TPA: DUF4129 domain-containing protein [Thermoanaerobaculia bacterium]|jgi:hypothetical protein
MMRRLLAALLFFVATSASALPIHDYVARLERLHALMRANQLDVARTESALLLRARIEIGTQRFNADDSLLQAISVSKQRDAHLQSRLAATIVELRRVAPAGSTTVDPKILAAIVKEEAVAELKAGGDALPIDENLTVNQRLMRMIEDTIAWIGDVLLKFWQWLVQFIPDEMTTPGGSGRVSWIVIVTVGLIAIVLLILAVRVLRRSRAAAPEPIESTELLGSRKDEDPLSRGAGEWEKYAAQLAAAGRIREAIRAWYHAVLVTCYASGILHFRKGRTNWEYISLLGPQVSWRPELIELTRRFEVEWYGHTESSSEALEDCSARARQILEAIRRERSAA